MSGFQGTPGPWVLKNFGGPQISGPNGYAVATMWGASSVGDLKGKDAANAHLIAASPDLLASLQEALTDGGIPGWEDRAQAAIAKALSQ